MTRVGIFSLRGSCCAAAWPPMRRRTASWICGHSSPGIPGSHCPSSNRGTHDLSPVSPGRSLAPQSLRHSGTRWRALRACDRALCRVDAARCLQRRRPANRHGRRLLRPLLRGGAAPADGRRRARAATHPAHPAPRLGRAAGRRGDRARMALLHPARCWPAVILTAWQFARSSAWGTRRCDDPLVGCGARNFEATPCTDSFPT